MKPAGVVVGCIWLLIAAPINAADMGTVFSALRQGNYTAAFAELKPLAAQGVASAQFDLGVMYSHGQGVKQDDALAREWYLKAASQGFVPAQANLGRLYMVAPGPDRDYAKAFEWLSKAAAQGDVGAQSNLGMLYLRGLGRPRDFVKAAGWFGAAAMAGNAYAQTNLGLMYASGRGLPRDSVVGYALLILSSIALEPHGDVEGKTMRDREAVAGGMTPAQIGESEALAFQIQRDGMLRALKNRGSALPESMMDPSWVPPPPAPPATVSPAAVDLTYQATHLARFPRKARAAGHQGLVVVVALLAANGKIEYTMVERSSGYPELDASAVAAVGSWKYTPCHRNGQPVTCYLREPVNFSLAEK